MNSKINKLAEQAKKSVPHGLSPDKWIETYNELFAELVINKCANIVWDEADKALNRDVNDAGYKIIDYFFESKK